MPPEPDTAALVWSEGVRRLRGQTGMGDDSARRVIGRLIRDSGKRPDVVLAALRDMPITGDAVAWLTAAVKQRRYPSGWHQVMADDRERAERGEELDPMEELRRAALGLLDDPQPPQPRLRIAHG